MSTETPTSSSPTGTAEVRRVDVTEAAVTLLRELTDDNGPLMFHQSGGCCDGSSPMCYPQGEFLTGDSDVRLGGGGGGGGGGGTAGLGGLAVLAAALVDLGCEESMARLAGGAVGVRVGRCCRCGRGPRLEAVAGPTSPGTSCT